MKSDSEKLAPFFLLFVASISVNGRTLAALYQQVLKLGETSTDKWVLLSFVILHFLVVDILFIVFFLPAIVLGVLAIQSIALHPDLFLGFLDTLEFLAITMLLSQFFLALIRWLYEAVEAS